MRGTDMIWRPYTQMGTDKDFPRVIRAQGAYLYTDDGRKILDAISSWWVITHGHCHPQIVAAVANQVKDLDQIIFANFSHQPAEELVECLARVLPKTLNRMFFSDNGSTSVEVALKMALQTWQYRGQPQRNKFIGFAKAYHGDTFGAMSVSGEGTFTAPFSGLTFEVLRAEQGRYSFDPIEAYTQDFKRLITDKSESIAAVIIEPLVQGAGGMIVWPEKAVQEIARVCRQHGVFLIFDEVMTGFGRTGELFAMDKVGVIPDFLCLSKGLTAGILPLGLTVTTDEVWSQFYSSDRSRMFFHGHSFTANPVSCAAAVANLKLYANENMRERTRGIEQTHWHGIQRLDKFPLIKDRRVCGTIAAFEFAADDAGYLSAVGPLIYRELLKEGIFVRPLGSVIYMLPPYCITIDELAGAWKSIENVIAKIC